MTWDQIKGPADRAIIALLMFLVGKGWITPDAVTDYAALLIALVGAAYGWWINRPKAIQQSSVALPNTMVVEVNPNHSSSDTAGAMAALPGVTKVMVSTEKLAEAVPSTKVVAA